MQTQAAVLNQPNGPFEIETIDVGEPQGNEVRIAIKAVGICHTDLVVASGAMGLQFPAALAPLPHPVGKSLYCAIPSIHMIEYDKPLHPRAFDQQVPFNTRSQRPGAHCVIDAVPQTTTLAPIDSLGNTASLMRPAVLSK